MTLILTALMTPALLAAPAGGTGFTDLVRSASYAPAPEAPTPARPEPASDRNEGTDLPAGTPCWQRTKEPGADRMGMPPAFCVRSMKIASGIHSSRALILSADGLSGIYDLRMGPAHDGLFRASAVIYDRTPLIMVCGPAESAYMELSFLLDERGEIVSDPEVRSFYGTTPDTCAYRWDYREIVYSRSY